MRYNGLVHFVCMTVLVVSLGLALAVNKPITEKRKELQLAAGTDMGDAVPPHIALATAALGSFRGVAVNYLWYRANELKEQGKFFDANELAELITTLQPRFPQVWAFHAWNMAYNISVQTYTEQERYDWVMKGVHLLRERGIPYNPRSVRLYRELSWIFFHKIGQFSDDAHWYYKVEMALEWQQVLGAPNESASTEDVIARFAKVVDAPDDMQTLYEKSPKTKELMEKFTALGLKPDLNLLLQIGKFQMFKQSADAAIMGLSTALLPDDDRKKFVTIIEDPAQQEALEALQNHLRKRVLIDHYRMKPEYMLKLMQMFGPIDWRHPGAHGSYWAALGTEAGGEVRNKKDIDLINTYRQNIHSLQTLFRQGRISFDPISRRLDYLPDPRFIDSYEKALDLATETLKDQIGDSYKSGHENLLLQAMDFVYMYGDEARARQIFDKVRNLYGKEPHNVMSGRYTQPMENLIVDDLKESLDMMQYTRQFVDATVRRGISQGLATGQPLIFEKFIKLAKLVYDQYRKDKMATAIASQDRMSLLSFDQTVNETYMSYMKDTGVHPLTKARVWLHTPETLRRDVYGRLKDELNAQFAAAQLDPKRAFPAPEGWTDKPAEGGEAAPGTKPVPPSPPAGGTERF